MDRRRTFTDQIDLLLLVYPVDEQKRAGKLARLAVQQTYNKLPLMHEWANARRSQMIQLQEPYTTGVVSISGSVVTLTDGTWPSWAANGQIQFSGDFTAFRVIERISDSQIQIDGNQDPGTISDEYFELALARYDLPDDFGQLIFASRPEDGAVLIPLYEREHSGADEWLEEPATPLYCQVRGFRGGKLQLELHPPPDQTELVRVDYRSRFRPLGTGSYSSGTISISGSTVTGSGTTFPTDSVGKTLRVGTAANAPTGLFGDTPYDAAYTVVRRVSDTSLILSETATTVSGVKYVLDDPIDIDPESMQEMFDRQVEAMFARLAQLDIRADAEARADYALRRAKAMDNRLPVPDAVPPATDIVTWGRTT